MIINRVINRYAFISTHNYGSEILVLRCLSSKNDCNNPTPQTEGKTVQEWPPKPPQPWQSDCGEINPVNYDPYKIKTPNIAVPPMPPSTAQIGRMLYSSDWRRGGEYDNQSQYDGYQGRWHPGDCQQGEGQPKQKEQAEEEPSFFNTLKSFFRGKKKPSEDNFDSRNEDDYSLFHTPIVNLWDDPQAKHYYNTAIMHPDYWKDMKSQPKIEEEYPKAKLGYHGSLKYKFAFHEPWKPLDRIALMSLYEKEENPSEDQNKEEEGKELNQIDPMIEMTRCVKNRCMRYEKLPPWKCPPPPKKPFPWKYFIPWIILFTSMGAFYRLYLWREEKEKITDTKPIWRPRPKVKKPFYAEDLPNCVQYLIVGGGAASWAAYLNIAQLHEQAKVFIITLEDIPPYAKPPLSKAMWWNKDPPNISTLKYVDDSAVKTMYFTDCKNYVSPVKFARMKTGPAVSLATGWWVTRVDPEEHCVYLDSVNGEVPMYYERCLLAPGARPKKLGVFERASKPIRKKVSYMSCVRDLEIAYRKVQEAKHVTIVGGGILGTELAWTLAKRNQKILNIDPEEEVPELTQVIKDGGLMPAILPEYLGAWAANKIRVEGINIIPKAQVYDVYMDEDERLNLILSNGQKIITDYVLVAIGVEPRVEIALRSDLEVDEDNGGGIVVNGELEARKHLFVAGDAANIYTTWKNTRTRFDHFPNAFETGMLAGANMTGEWTPSASESHFHYTLGKIIDMEVIGEVGACMPTVGIFRECDDKEEDENEYDGLKKIQVKTEPLPVSNADGDKPCAPVVPAHPCRNLYKRGMLFYIRDDVVVGVTFWNIPPFEDRTRAVIEMLRARPTVSEINMLAELVGFSDTQCVYKKTAAELPKPLCFEETTLKKW